MPKTPAICLCFYPKFGDYIPNFGENHKSKISLTGIFSDNSIKVKYYLGSIHCSAIFDISVQENKMSTIYRLHSKALNSLQGIMLEC